MFGEYCNIVSTYNFWFSHSRIVESNMGVKETEQTLHQNIILFLKNVKKTLLETLIRKNRKNFLDP